MAQWQHVISGDESKFQLYLIDGRLRGHRLPGKRFQQRHQAYRVQAVGGLVNIWGAFHSGVKSPSVLRDRQIPHWWALHDCFVKHLSAICRQHFGNNYRYQDVNATPHRAQVVLEFLQQCNITKMEQPARSPDCKPIEHMWGELGGAITSMDNPPQNFGELH